jgi:hypothetical protein
LTLVAPNEPHLAPVGQRQTLILESLLSRVEEVHALEDARAAVEVRHLDGAEGLFPAVVRAWESQPIEGRDEWVAAARRLA